VIYEPSPCGLVHLGVGLAIDLLEQETFKDIETYEEKINEDDADNERAERGKPRDRLQRYMRNVGTVVIDKSFVQLSRDHGDFHDQVDRRGVERSGWWTVFETREAARKQARKGRFMGVNGRGPVVVLKEV
tara:strand:+ start:97 stop:489 length:393 start_codon:yes stop_codon:yes gene_type:complete